MRTFILKFCFVSFFLTGLGIFTSLQAEEFTLQMPAQTTSMEHRLDVDDTVLSGDADMFAVQLEPVCRFYAASDRCIYLQVSADEDEIESQNSVSIGQDNLNVVVTSTPLGDLSTSAVPFNHSYNLRELQASWTERSNGLVYFSDCGTRLILDRAEVTVEENNPTIQITGQAQSWTCDVAFSDRHNGWDTFQVSEIVGQELRSSAVFSAEIVYKVKPVSGESFRVESDVDVKDMVEFFGDPSKAIIKGALEEALLNRKSASTRTASLQLALDLPDWTTAPLTPASMPDFYLSDQGVLTASYNHLER